MKKLIPILLLVAITLITEAEEKTQATSSGSDPLVYLTIREVTINARDSEVFGFDWLFSNQSAIAERPERSQAKIEVLDSREELLDRLSETERSRAEKNREEAFGKVAAVFTDPQFQVVLRALDKKEGVAIETAPGALVGSGQSALLHKQQKRVAVVPTVGADHYTLDLEIFLSGYESRLFKSKDHKVPDAKIAIWEGQTVAIRAGRQFGKDTTIFVTAHFVDAEGQAYYPQKKKDSGE